MNDSTAGIDQEALYGLMAMVEEQQKAVTLALQDLQKHQKALDRVAGQVGQAASDLGRAEEAIVARIRQSAVASTREGTATLMAAVSAQAVSSLETAARPLLARLDGGVKAAGEAEGRLRAAVQRFTWRSMGWWGTGMAAACLVALVSVWWSRYELADLRGQRDLLKIEIAQLTINADELAEKGARIRMNRCAERLCVEIAPNQGANVRVQGAWQGQDGRQYVIPRGY